MPLSESGVRRQEKFDILFKKPNFVANSGYNKQFALLPGLGGGPFQLLHGMSARMKYEQNKIDWRKVLSDEV